MNEKGRFKKLKVNQGEFFYFFHWRRTWAMSELGNWKRRRITLYVQREWTQFHLNRKNGFLMKLFLIVFLHKTHQKCRFICISTIIKAYTFKLLFKYTQSFSRLISIAWYQFSGVVWKSYHLLCCQVHCGKLRHNAFIYWKLYWFHIVLNFLFILSTLFCSWLCFTDPGSKEKCNF